ncbi:uncharacterized protein B0P05DRAFT_534491 [Gilbertella persicaria]|uniref:uncharacterized protein n=1 Tax=Gilbertella persicaria TaxID=101096 RepID=UPI00221F63E6|nr:uncharacterized protein B0P05DRAFT_534491 [Gilbertella persicaria]KAI8084185.1 hypothetical protein B0P05DRAFT_534491 [Gilbertella persicaria]
MSESIKKRKWDQDDNNSDKSPSSKISKVETDPKKAVSEAAARINAMLAQKSTYDDGLTLSPGKEGEFVKNIPINELKNRYMLTRGATQTQIQQETGADVITRGKYYPDISLANDREPPLYLHITAPTKAALDKAVAKIEELIETAQVPQPGTGFSSRDDKPDGMKRPERKFFEKRLPVEVSGTPHFNLRAKIVGPNGAFVKHIQQETGCRVQLKGKGSGFYEASTGVESDEPLHVHLSCIREEGLEAGIKLTQDLLDTVKAEAERGPPQGYKRGYDNTSRGGYNGYNSYTTSPSSAGADATGAYDYDAYNSYYSSYYGQPSAQGYQYDPNAYYSYYGYPDPNASTATPPSATSTPPAPPPPPPPASSSSSPPPPPPPPSS